MGYLGATGYADAPPLFDPVLTFGWFGDRRGSSVEQQELNWLPPGPVDIARKSKHDYPNLPAWLDVKRPEPKEKMLDLDKILGPPPKLKYVGMKEYRKRVKQTNTLQDVRDLHMEFGNATLNTLLCSIAGFDHLLSRYLNHQKHLSEDSPEVRRSLSYLFEYLKDERLELSKGQNLKKLLAALKVRGEVSLSQFSILRHCTIDLLQESERDSDSRREATLGGLVNLIQIGQHTRDRLSQPRMMLELFEEICCLNRKGTRVLIVPSLVELPISLRTIHLATAVLTDLTEPVLSMHTDKITRFVQKIIASDLEQQVPADSTQTDGSNLSAFLAGLNRGVVVHLARIVTLSLARGVRNVRQDSLELRYLCFWADTLRSVLDCEWHVGLNSRDRRLALDDIAAGSKPADVPFVFHGFEGTGIARTWVRHWLPQAQSALGFEMVSDYTDSKKLLEDAWNNAFTKLDRSSGHFLSAHHVAEASLIKAAGVCGLDWEALLLDMMNLAKVLDHPADIDAMVRGLKRLQGKSTLTIKHREFLNEFINQQSSRDVFSALRTFETDTRLFLSDQPNLMQACLGSTKIKTIRILRLLRKPDRDAQVVSGLRKYDTTCGLSDERIDLIHDVALAIATSDRFMLRQASSSVHYCWKLLKAHQAPMDERLARAAVVAGVLRYLTAEEWIPTKQFQWALKVVTSIHGEEAANEIDQLAYRMRPKRTWKLSSPPEKTPHQTVKRHWRDLEGLTPLKRKLIGEGRDVPENREWLYTRAARITTRAMIIQKASSKVSGGHVPKERIRRLRFGPQMKPRNIPRHLFIARPPPNHRPHSVTPLKREETSAL